jgi:hypothetical protein
VSLRRLSPWAQAAGVAALLILLTRPLLFAGQQRGADFWVHYWYVWHQAEALKGGGPSLYVYDLRSMFVPRYAFYGGTLYAVTGALGLATGSVLRAYQATYVLGSAAAYGGWWWFGRQAGLGRLATHAPALVFVTAAYSITLLNPRSDWPEHIGVSMLPLMAASALSVLRADRLRLGPVLALAGSTILFTGSHNVTLLCGGSFAIALAALTWLCVPQARALATRGGLLRVLAVVVPAVLVNAWFLLPDLAYNSETFVASLRPLWDEWLDKLDYLVAPGRLYTLDRSEGDRLSAGYGVFALPVLAMAWTVVAGVVARCGLQDPWMRLLLLLGVLTAAVLLAISQAGALLAGPFTMIQFAFRLESYANLAIAGAVLVALVLLRERSEPARRALGVALGAIILTAAVQAAMQVDVSRNTARSTDLTPFPRYYDPKGETHAQDYGAGEDAAQDISRMRTIIFDPKDVHDGATSGTITARAGERFATNIVAPRRFVAVTGARIVGVEPYGHTVIEVDPDGVVAGRATVSVAETRPPAAVAGRWLSLLGLLGLAANLATIFVGRRRRARSRTQPGAGDRPVAIAR